jgi:hypothetical protein
MNIKIVSYIIMVVFSVGSLFAQQKSAPYDFPMKPGTTEWKALTSHDHKKQVCQIPQSILSSMSTMDLVETCLNYPLLIDIIAYDRKQEGFEHVTQEFNGLQELLKRKDVGSTLVERYKKMNPDDIDSNWTSHQKGEYSVQFFFVEILLAQEAVIANLSKIDRTQLLEESYNKILAKGKHPDIFGLIGFTNNTLLMGRIMLKDNYAPFVQSVSQDAKLNRILVNAITNNKENMNEIIMHARQYLGQN